MSTKRGCTSISIVQALVLSISLLLFGTTMAATQQLEDKTADLPSGKVTYKDSGGKGVPVLFLHPFNKLMWDKQIESFTAAGYRFISVDFRDLMSGLVSESGFARINELITALGLGKVHLVGTGGAGVLATQFALANSDKVRSLTAVNTLAGLRDPSFNEVEARLRSPQFNAMPVEWRELGPTYRATDPEGVKQWLELSATRPQLPPMPATGPAVLSASNPNTVTLERFDNFKVPFELVGGDQDQYTPPGILRMFVARVKTAQGVVIPDTGHNSQWENPDAFNRAVLSFIKKH